MLTGDTARKAAELMNSEMSGSFTALFGPRWNVVECHSCHGVDGMGSVEKGVMQDCAPCHDDPTAANPPRVRRIDPQRGGQRCRPLLSCLALTARLLPCTTANGASPELGSRHLVDSPLGKAYHDLPHSTSTVKLEKELDIHAREHEKVHHPPLQRHARRFPGREVRQGGATWSAG